MSESRVEDILQAYLNESPYDNAPQSRIEEILVSILNTTPYDKAPNSRLEDLLIQLKAFIEEGGGGGGTTVYELDVEPASDLGNNGDYAIVDGKVLYPYARNDGSNYVTFDIKGNQIYGMDIRIGTLSTGQNFYLAGSDGDHFCIGRAGSDSQMEYFIRGNRSNVVPFSHDFRMLATNGHVYINDVETGTYSDAYPLSAYASPFSIYSVNGNRTSMMNIYYVKLLDFNGEIIMDAFPIKDNNDVVCFKDKITNNLYYPNSSSLQYGNDSILIKGVYKKVNDEWVLIF